MCIYWYNKHAPRKQFLLSFVLPCIFSTVYSVVFSSACSAFSTCCACAVTPVNVPLFCLLFCRVFLSGSASSVAFFSFSMTCTNSEPGRSALLRPGTVQFWNTHLTEDLLTVITEMYLKKNKRKIVRWAEWLLSVLLHSITELLLLMHLLRLG